MREMTIIVFSCLRRFFSERFRKYSFLHAEVRILHAGLRYETIIHYGKTGYGWFAHMIAYFLIYFGRERLSMRMEG